MHDVCCVTDTGTRDGAHTSDGMVRRLRTVSVNMSGKGDKEKKTGEGKGDWGPALSYPNPSQTHPNPSHLM